MFDTSTILIQTGVCVKFQIENFLELQCLLLYKVGLLLILSSWSNLSIMKKKLISIIKKTWILITYSISNILLKHNIFTRTFQEVRILLKKYYRAFKNLQQLGPKLHNGYSILKNPLKTKLLRLKGFYIGYQNYIDNLLIAFVFAK